MKLSLAVGAAVLASVAPAFAGTPAHVTVRVEGSAQTRLARTATQTSATPVSKDGDPAHACPGTSAIGALDAATAHDWDGPWNFGSQTVEVIKGETHKFDANADPNPYWTFWMNDSYQNAGACDTEVQEGDDILWFPACYSPTDKCGEQGTLTLTAPATAAPGANVTVHVAKNVVSFDANYTGTTSHSPAAGATVAAGDATVTTNAQGDASFTPAARGPVAVRATQDPYVRSATETVCVTDGHDGFCGTTKAGEPPAPTPPCATNGHDGRCATRDSTPAVGRILGITDREVFAAGHSPRELRGVVDPDPSGISTIKLRLTRRAGGRCSWWSARAERFVAGRCDKRVAFRIGDRADWFYLLPRALAPGRYVLDVIAIDRALNRDVLARGRSRITFTVAAA